MDSIGDLSSSSKECVPSCHGRLIGYWFSGVWGERHSAPAFEARQGCDDWRMPLSSNRGCSDTRGGEWAGSTRSQTKASSQLQLSIAGEMVRYHRSPVLYPAETASARSLTFSAAKMALVSRLTVAELMKSLEAISLLVAPEAIRRSISIWRRVRTLS